MLIQLPKQRRGEAMALAFGVGHEREWIRYGTFCLMEGDFRKLRTISSSTSLGLFWDFSKHTSLLVSKYSKEEKAFIM